MSKRFLVFALLAIVLAFVLIELVAADTEVEQDGSWFKGIKDKVKKAAKGINSAVGKGIKKVKDNAGKAGKNLKNKAGKAAGKFAKSALGKKLLKGVKIGGKILANSPYAKYFQAAKALVALGKCVKSKGKVRPLRCRRGEKGTVLAKVKGKSVLCCKATTGGRGDDKGKGWGVGIIKAAKDLGKKFADSVKNIKGKKNSGKKGVKKAKNIFNFSKWNFGKKIVKKPKSASKAALAGKRCRADGGKLRATRCSSGESGTVFATIKNRKFLCCKYRAT